MCAALRRACADNNARRQCYAYCFTSNRRAIGGDRRAPGENSHFRQRPVIFGGYRAACAADPCGLSRARRCNQEEKLVKDKVCGIWAAGQVWMAWPTDVARTAVAVIEKTRLEWVARGNESRSSGETDVDRTRFAHPLFRLALNAMSSRSGRERVVRARARRRTARQITV